MDRQTIAVALGALFLVILIWAWMSSTGRLDSTERRDAATTQQYQRPTPTAPSPGGGGRMGGGGAVGPGRECDGDRPCEFGKYCTERGVCVRWGEK